MNRSITLFVAALALLVSACGSGAPEQTPAEQPATAPQSQPAPEATAPQSSTTAAPAASAPQTSEAPVTPPSAPEKPIYTRTDLTVGTGAEAVNGRGLSVNYTGWLYDPSRPDLKGQMFDTSKGRGPFDFVLGAGQVIPGWDQGFSGMKVGGSRRLIIPPDMAYGSQGAGGVIPPNATLVFEMELLGVK